MRFLTVFLLGFFAVRRASGGGRTDRTAGGVLTSRRGERERERPGRGESRKGEKKRGNVTKPIRDGRLVVKGTERPKVRGEREKGRGETYE